MKIPRQLNLLSSYLPPVKVKVVTEREAVKKAGLDPEWYKNVNGWWDQETNTIYIKKALPNWQKAEVFRHELLHAVIDTEYLDRAIRLGKLRKQEE
jgi:Zn-dependent peptidase ImmA (M78 family)